MIKIEFTEKAIDELRYQRFHHPHPRVQRKMETLLLKSDGLPHHQITRILGVSENTLRQYLREYEEGGIEALRTLRFRKPQSELTEHRQSLEAYFEEHPSARRQTTFYNVLGAIDAITHRLVTVSNDTDIDAESVCELLRKIAAAHPDMPVTLVLDNARYQFGILLLAQSKRRT